MIARHRGDLRAHSRWRPSTPAVPPAVSTAPENAGLPGRQPDELPSERRDLARPGSSQRKPRTFIAIATVIAIAVIAGQQHPGPPAAVPREPSTPQLWVSQWTAATLESPAVVCDHLYAPALARAFKGDTGHSCAWYYTSVKSTSFRIRHVLEAGPTAAVEAQELGAGRKWGYFTILLSHITGGWQAVDVVPGGSVRAR